MSTTQHSPTLSNPPSPKVIALGIVTLVMTAGSSAVLFLQTEQGAAIYAALPIWLIVVVRSLLTGVSAALAGIRAQDPQRVLDLAVSPKVLAGVGLGIVAQVVVDLVAFFLGDGRGLYQDWNPVAVVAFSSVLPLIAAAAAGYVIKDPARVTPLNQTPHPIEPVPLETIRASVAHQADTGSQGVQSEEGRTPQGW